MFQTEAIKWFEYVSVRLAGSHTVSIDHDLTGRWYLVIRGSYSGTIVCRSGQDVSRVMSC